MGYIPKDKEHLHSVDVGITYLIKSLGTFLIALVLFIFAHGVYTLFISNAPSSLNKGVLRWIQTPNIGHLKKILGEVIVIILFVKFLEVVFLNIDDLKWELLFFPIFIILMALGLKILKLNKIEGESKKGYTGYTGAC
ncbi:Uncharacterized protein family, UPF0114 [Arenibacter nanhaiticus]|uniref:Uncharacterized protein family, UPF0114 n=1 Tax=Arenibacter nanhaiticus TaxID=558155 RepID=A0A1M6M8C6_9FLAO|nr:Uncharacterized protein family, UPF0114 [Arenibacter nanhaiticus]